MEKESKKEWEIRLPLSDRRHKKQLSAFLIKKSVILKSSK